MVTEKEFNHLWEVLREVPDPEIPIINLVELGVVRNIAEDPEKNKIVVTITPTYTGCPAKKLFNDLILEKLAEHGYKNVEVISQLYPVWSTDWLSDETKKKLLDEGISPPTFEDKIIVCPNCKSANTKLISQFGSTPCQSLYSCRDCSEPFNYFKCY